MKKCRGLRNLVVMLAQLLLRQESFPGAAVPKLILVQSYRENIPFPLHPGPKKITNQIKIICFKEILSMAHLVVRCS
jgi:hypothetical protein